MKTLFVPVLTMIAVASAAAAPKPVHPCAADAREKAKALLVLHMDGANLNHSIDDKVVQRPPIRALKGKGRFDVLEVVGYVYKAQYRIRLIYAQIPESCLLMGQEVLEISNPY
jgi:hypothetical protein